MECVYGNKHFVFKSFTGAFCYRKGNEIIDCQCPACRKKRRESAENACVQELGGYWDMICARNAKERENCKP